MTATSKINPADHLPDHASPAQIKGLLGKVDIWRDAWGIPHVRGEMVPMKSIEPAVDEET